MVFPLKNIKQLERGVLPGVKGLSGGPEIIKKFLGMRHELNLVLRMPGEDTIQLNNLTEIPYTNPKKLLEGGLATLARITNEKDYIYIRSSLLDKGKQFFGEILEAHLAKTPALLPLYIKMKRQKRKPGQPRKFKGFMRKISSFDTSVRWLRDYILFWAGKRDAHLIEALPHSLFARALFYSTRKMALQYRAEKEWLLQKGEPLQIPVNSVLYVTYFDLPPEWMKQYREKGKDFLTEMGILGWQADIVLGKLDMNLKSMRVLRSSNLASRYKIILLDPIKFKAVVPGIWF